MRAAVGRLLQETVRLSPLLYVIGPAQNTPTDRDGQEGEAGEVLSSKAVKVGVGLRERLTMGRPGPQESDWARRSAAGTLENPLPTLFPPGDFGRLTSGSHPK